MPLDASHRGYGELRLEVEDHLRLFGGLHGHVAGELQHLRDVRHVFRPKLLRFLVGFRVVVAVGKTQAALERRRDDLARVLPVLLRAELEEGVDSPLLQARDLLLKRGPVGNRGDPVELFLERRDPGRFDRGLVHAARVEIRELSLLGTRGSRLSHRQLLQGLVQDLAVPLVQFVERAPARVVGGDRVLLEPPAVGVPVEVAARGRVRVHVSRIQSSRCRGARALRRRSVRTDRRSGARRHGSPRGAGQIEGHRGHCHPENGIANWTHESHGCSSAPRYGPNREEFRLRCRDQMLAILGRLLP